MAEIIYGAANFKLPVPGSKEGKDWHYIWSTEPSVRAEGHSRDVAFSSFKDRCIGNGKAEEFQFREVPFLASGGISEVVQQHLKQIGQTADTSDKHETEIRGLREALEALGKQPGPMPQTPPRTSDPAPSSPQGLLILAGAAMLLAVIALLVAVTTDDKEKIAALNKRMDEGVPAPVAIDAENPKVAVSLPLGSVVAWPLPLKDAGDLPSGWLLCHGGSSYKLDDYPEIAKRIRANSNWWPYGSKADTFTVPDYQGYFLRGLDNPLGKAARRDVGPRTFNGKPSSTAQVGSEQGFMNYLPKRIYRQAQAGGNFFLMRPPSPDSDNEELEINVPEYGAETRPKNIAVNWIIYVGKWTTK